MQTIFITFIGTTIYNNANYHMGNDVYTGHFGTIAQIRNVAKPDKLNKVYCVVTDQVVAEDLLTPDQQEVYPGERDKNSQKPNNYEYFKKEINDIVINGNCLIKSTDKIKIDINSSGLDFYNIFNNNVLSKIDSNEEVILHIDTTNCFRSLPQTMFTVLKMIEKFNTNVKISSIVYWRTDGDYNNFYYMDLIETFHNTQIAEDISYFFDSFHLPGFENQFTDTNTSSIIRQFNGELKSIEKYLQYANIEKLCLHIRQAVGLMRKMLSGEEEVNSVFIPYIQNIDTVYSKIIDKDDTTMSLNLANELLKRNQIQLAVTFLEAIFNRTIINIYYNSYPEKTFNKQKEYQIIKNASICLKLKYGKLKNIDDESLSDVQNFYLQLSKNHSSFPYRRLKGKKIITIISDFLDLRNAMNHGHGDSVKNIENIFENFSHAIKLIKDEYQAG